jgi:hypothetical protein
MINKYFFTLLQVYVSHMLCNRETACTSKETFFCVLVCGHSVKTDMTYSNAK